MWTNIENFFSPSQVYSRIHPDPKFLIFQFEDPDPDLLWIISDPEHCGLIFIPGMWIYDCLFEWWSIQWCFFTNNLEYWCEVWLIDSRLLSKEGFPFICSDCGKGFRNKYKLNSHEKKHSVGGQGQGTCTCAGYQFAFSFLQKNFVVIIFK